MVPSSDQIPFVVTLSQTGDVNQADQSFIQNRPVTFNVGVHDPSQYLSGSDMTFTWDFGDNSGTLISRQPSVTHTYLSTGTFRPQFVLMAAIPNGCVPNPTAGGAVSAGEFNTGIVLVVLYLYKTGATGLTHPEIRLLLLYITVKINLWSILV